MIMTKNAIALLSFFTELYNALSVYAASIAMGAAMIAIYLDITEIGMYWLNDFVPKKVYSIGINIIKEKNIITLLFLAIPIMRR
jgi:hypothetical protein